MNQHTLFLFDSIIPDSSKLDFMKHINNHPYEEDILQFLTEYEAKCESIKNSFKSNESNNFSNLLNSQELKIFLRKNFRIFSRIKLILVELFYLNPDVRTEIGLPLIPPFPEGNVLEQLDFNLLEDVYNRGKIYR